MKFRLYISVTIVAIAAMLTMGCSQSGSKFKVPSDAPLRSESDSLAYIIGMNVASELEKMDSLINVEVVCRAIIEHSQRKLLMSQEEARTSYLRYLLYLDPERQRGIEERFLADLATSNRSFTRTASGVTYNIAVIGDESLQPKTATDWVTIALSIYNVSGELIYPRMTQPSTDELDEEVEEEESAEDTEQSVDPIRVEESFAFEDLPAGVAEALKLIGKGGHIKAWIPSKLGFGENGSEKYGVKPLESTLFDIKIIDVERNAAKEHKAAQF